MAFPGTYNFSYYKGDTLEFKVYPKKTDGSTFDLTDYSVKFSFSTSRGSSGVSSLHEAFATISTGKDFITAVIRPEDSSYLTAGTTYVYDIQITKNSTPYPFIHTVLTGTISVTDEVTQ
jgi:hypothetical protein